MATQDKKVERPPAPKITIDQPFLDERAELIKQLEKEDPDYVYMCQREDITDRRLKQLSQEIVTDADGNKLFSHGDIIVKVPKSIWNEKREIENERSKKMVESIVDIDESTFSSTPKKPSEGKKRKK